ncbi:hypothetical protein [Conchiformibius kuhniae]|uniref:Uncharacterized protein n=1 Tax=Conchiformibius kuhniae TaxID=211502 RepID=A0A8T9MUZ4_9NEIS|nr:hypothetical protein [Conchiformibius kuhniae]UOP05011.1 hypothetical protein LVJ77_01420 [Conchiformibius kuhniae]
MRTEPTNHRPDDDEQDIYDATTVMFVVFGGATAGLLLWLPVWLLLEGRNADLYLRSFLMWGAILGLPASWLTQRSVRKRNLRRDWRGCLKTAVWGAWWHAVTVGSLLCLLVSVFCILFDVRMRIDVFLLLCFGLPAALGAVTALLLSVFLPKPET